eukprot:s2567_g1.t1
MTYRPRSRSPDRRPPPPAINVAGLSHCRFFGEAANHALNAYRPPRSTQRSVMIITNFQSLNDDACTNPYHVGLDLRLYEHLTDIVTRAMWQYMKYVPAPYVGEFRSQQILNEISTKMAERQITFPAADLELRIRQDASGYEGPTNLLDPELHIVNPF